MIREPQFKLHELAEAAGVTPRTVRYYVAQGLLPSPGRLGPGTRYGADHLRRLSLIKQLQAEHIPLAEIRERLADSTDARLERASDAPAVRPTAAHLRQMAATRIVTDVQSPKDRSRWYRFVLSAELELHVRDPHTPMTDALVNDLIDMAAEQIE